MNSGGFFASNGQFSVNYFTFLRRFFISASQRPEPTPTFGSDEGLRTAARRPKSRLLLLFTFLSMSHKSEVRHHKGLNVAFQSEAD